MDTVEIIDVSPRDGLQSEHRILPTEIKVELIRRLQAAGVRELEATSFVHPKKVPQMADAVDVIAGVKAAGIDVQQIGLALNVRGAERAIDAGVDEVGFVLVSTDTFSQRNQGAPVERSIDIWREIQGMCRAANVRCNVLIASAEGGVEIEKVAAETPEAIITEPIHPTLGLQPHQARTVAFKLGFKGKQVGQAVKVMLNLAKLFESKDCSLAEINPLIVTPPSDNHPDGEVLAIDAKFNFDDNGLFRHKDIQALFDPTEENPLEMRATRMDLSYIALDGSIGCLVNGAGLAMATMDTIKLHGGDPANFLDVGGGATEEAVTEAFRIILSDEKVKGVLVNIFGGIMDCAVIAQGIINAAKEIGFTVPLVVRLEGTNVEAGRALLEKAAGELPTLQTGADLKDAAEKVVKAVG